MLRDKPETHAVYESLEQLLWLTPHGTKCPNPENNQPTTTRPVTR